MGQLRDFCWSVCWSVGFSDLLVPVRFFSIAAVFEVVVLVMGSEPSRYFILCCFVSWDQLFSIAFWRSAFLISAFLSFRSLRCYFR